MKSVYQALSLGLMTAGFGLVILLLILVVTGQLFNNITAGFGIAGVMCIFLGYLARQAGKR